MNFLQKLDKQWQQANKFEPLEPIDLFFAASFSEKPSFFLAYLYYTARNGHLCIIVNKDSIVPEPPSNLKDLIINDLERYPIEAVQREDNRYYLKRNYECEKQILHHLKRIKESPPTLSFSLKESPLGLEQKLALEKCRDQSLTLISGGPGTGKTTLCAELITAFPGHVAFAAPTGKATANLRKKINKATIKTLHTLVQEGPLPYDLIIIDEGSMVEASLMAELFSQIKPGARLILLGDQDQLPPVEEGSIFQDLVERESSNVAFLKTCYRAELEEIITKAQRVKTGHSIKIEPLPTPEELCHSLNAKTKLLTPLRHGPYGVNALNQILYEKNKNEPIPVIITANDRQLNVYNGDLATLKSGSIYLEDGRVLPSYLLRSYEYAYVLSVHKSQGSEYDEVMVILPEGSEVFSRHMLYTAITRAKKKVTLYGKEETLHTILNNKFKRYSGI